MASNGTVTGKGSPALPYFGVRDTMTNAAAAPALLDLAAEKAEGRALQTSTGLEARNVDNVNKVSATQHMIS